MSTASPAYLEIIDFIAGGTTPEAVVNFHPSPEAQRRAAELVEREKLGNLSADEQAELDHYEELEHILRMAKARARLILHHGREISDSLRASPKGDICVSRGREPAVNCILPLTSRGAATLR